MEDNKKVFDALGNIMKSNFDKNQERPFQYVVEYRRISDDSFIGYHVSSFCQISDNRLAGKRYSGDNPMHQLGIIHDNLTSVLNVTDESTGIFDSLKRDVKKTYFKGISIDDVYLQADYLEDDCPKQTFVFKQVV